MKTYATIFLKDYPDGQYGGGIWYQYKVVMPFGDDDVEIPVVDPSDEPRKVFMEVKNEKAFFYTE